MLHSRRGSSCGYSGRFGERPLTGLELPPRWPRAASCLRPPLAPRRPAVALPAPAARLAGPTAPCAAAARPAPRRCPGSVKRAR